MKNPNWDAYQIFLQVGRHGGLTAAASATNLSPATIGRRMLDFEQQVGRSLFLRSQSGYALTQDGCLLMEQLLEMEAAARKVESWQQHPSAPSIVRIAAGTWISQLLSLNFADICTAGDDFRIDLRIAERRAALAHRESDIGIRAFKPEESNLAAIKVGEVAYAAYSSRGAGIVQPERWIAVGKEDAISAYLRWPHENKADQLIVTVSRPHALLDLAAAGAGISVLPCFVGDADPRLQRLGDEIAVLRHTQWIVMNNEDRHRRDIRTVADRMTRLFKLHAALFAGKRQWRD